MNNLSIVTMKNNEFLSEREIQLEILKEVKEINGKQPDNTKEVITDIGFIDNSHLCRAMNISKKTAAKWRRSNVLRFSKIEGKFYYKLADIKDMLQQNFNRS